MSQFITNTHTHNVHPVLYPKATETLSSVSIAFLIFHNHLSSKCHKYEFECELLFFFITCY